MTSHIESSPRSAMSARRLAGNDKTVHVFVLTSDKASTAAQLVADMFADPMFETALTTVTTEGGSTDPKDAEWYRLQWTLAMAKRSGAEYTLVIKDTSVTNASPAMLARVMSAALQVGGFDLFYLANWLDDCAAYEGYQALADSTTSIVKTQAPLGMQAILFTPSGRDMVLGEVPMAGGKFFDRAGGSTAERLRDAVRAGQLRAHTMTPPIIQFNPRAARKAEDYRKTQQCADPKTATPAPDRVGNTPIFETPSLMDVDSIPDIPIVADGLTPTNGTFYETMKQRGRSYPAWMWVVIIIVIVLAALGIGYLLKNRRA